MINNRSDGQGGNTQPSAEIERSARALGLNFIYNLPVAVVIGVITPALAMREALTSAPTPVLAFCRSGARSHI